MPIPHQSKRTLSARCIPRCAAVMLAAGCLLSLLGPCGAQAGFSDVK
jgi:hypothetical protein